MPIPLLGIAGSLLTNKKVINILFNKYVLGGVAVSGILYITYNYGYDQAETKWKIETARVITEAVTQTQKNFEEANLKDQKVLKNLRGSRDKYRNLWEKAQKFKPTNDCELTDGLFYDLNEKLSRDTSISE